LGGREKRKREGDPFLSNPETNPKEVP